MTLVKRKPITYEHDAIVYVPVFQKDFDKEGNLLYSPTFEYSLANADHDPELVASMKPDYILELRGTFKATTKPLVIEDDEDV